MYILPVICEVHAGMLNEKKSTKKRVMPNQVIIFFRSSKIMHICCIF